MDMGGRERERVIWMHRSHGCTRCTDACVTDPQSDPGYLIPHFSYFFLQSHSVFRYHTTRCLCWVGTATANGCMAFARSERQNLFLSRLQPNQDQYCHPNPCPNPKPCPNPPNPCPNPNQNHHCLFGTHLVTGHARATIQTTG